MNLTELQEIAMRQQQQIEINQQLLMAKEKRLKILKLEEQKNQQLALLTQANLNSQCNAINANNGNTNSPCSVDQNNLKLENLKQNVLGQELKIFKLKQLRNQIIEYKLSNSNMYSELDLIKSLFGEKERDLYKAVNKVAELSKQIEQLRKIKTLSSSATTVNTNTNTSRNQQQQASSPHLPASQLNVSELDKLKQELQIRNKLNEQQSKKIIQQHELFNKKQLEVLALDKRIDELKSRIQAKRSHLILNNLSDQQSCDLPQQQHQQQHHHHHRSQLMASPLDNQMKLSDDSRVQTEADSSKSVTTVANANGQSPSKLLAKFATKQEIANTYMNKETYQKYQQTSMRLIQQQQHQQQHYNTLPTSIPIVQLCGTTTTTTTTTNISNHAKQASDDASTTETTSSSTTTTSNNQNPVPPIVGVGDSSSSSLISLSPTSHTAHPTTTNNSNNANNNNTLPSHLKYEFDKIKYLPDMVKTIKKRHSISEIEGNANTIPPQIFQKILEKHHKNFIDQQQQTQQLQSQSHQTNKLSDIVEVAETTIVPIASDNKKAESSDFLNNNNNKPASTTIAITSGSNAAPTFPSKSTNTSGGGGVYLSTFMGANIKPQSKEDSPPLQLSTPTETITSIKSIIKQTSHINIETVQQQQQLDQESSENNNNNSIGPSRRVNFDPHALLLDAAVEGELELVARCAKRVRDISTPNDEGITALHNSVCAGHFDIVKFLVEHACDINYADNDGWTPLHCAASCNNIQMIKFLIESGAAIYSTTLSDNETAIRKCEEDEDAFQICYEYLSSAQANLGNPAYNGGVVYALYSYEAQNEDELTFKCYDELVVLEKHEDEESGEANDGWWTCKLVGGDEASQGLVPRNYLGLFPRVNPRFRDQEESTIC